MFALLFLLPLAVTAFTPLPPPQLFSTLIPQKLLATAQLTPGIPSTYPQYTTRDTGAWLQFGPNTWTTGFFPATLYAMYERAALCPKSLGRTSAAQWLELGRTSSTGEIFLEPHNTLQHDVGFVSFPFVEELGVNPQNTTAITAVNMFASDLAARFSPIVGCTRSWDSADPTDFQVIIDNMMNLEVLFVSANLTGNDTLRQIAISHADKTMQNHVRADGSSFHVVDYNSTTGIVIDQRTSQGYSNSSTWSRGQAWGIYGFANMYKNVGLQRHLDTARRMAAYFIDHMPSDGIVPWDFNAPLDPPRPADSSAAMIATNGLLLLAQQEQSLSPPNITGAKYYNEQAIKILTDTTFAFWKPQWQSLLSNGTVNNPQLNNLTGIVYGDYYFVRAGNELVKSGLAKCDFFTFSNLIDVIFG
ncbi:d-4,5 unsaturated-glucuronyl hydrolase-like protein [Artomyces pyxidatus]|uniref:D-4,5 unsaturated-glucuronyl hydrolase-like protein n=1 Tax=Artomyces pyxidatus TaxID=48021 RepID=A0ACB8SZJ6_9AGAM|nr:d-4,5 unsaturated-glucuronyl hydrolase-like protein [Artomyces pyxidatus]